MVAHVRLLETLRVHGEPVGLADLARALLAAPGPLPSGLARRVVAAALGRDAGELPDPLPADQLAPRIPCTDDTTPLELAEFAVVDLETTGLSPDRAAILEIGAVRVSALTLADRFSTLVDPERPVPARIAALTGIGDSMVAGAPRLADALPRFRSWLDDAPEASFVAHNAPFDESFLRRGLAEHGLPPLCRPVLCTRKLARRITPELGGFGLDRLSAGFGIANTARHRALGDAEATAHALIELLRRARAQLGIETLGELRALQERPPPRRPRGKTAPKDRSIPADP